MTVSKNDKYDLWHAVAEITKAYAAGNPMPLDQLPKVIRVVYEAVSGLQSEQARAEQEVARPAVAVRRSVTRSSIVCLEDGKAFKALKRHLRTAHNMTPGEYRTKWGLLDNYPMVAPVYAAKRSALAKKLGLGRKSGRGVLRATSHETSLEESETKVA